MNTFKSILWTVLGIVVFIAIIKFFIFLLPSIIVIGIVGYIVFKCKKAFNNKKRENESYNYYNNNQNSYEESNIDDSDNGEIIDVDYKEVDK